MSRKADSVPASDGWEGSGDPPEFEASLAELERIVTALEREELDLDEALRLFEAGVGHLRTANRMLGEARGRIEELIESSSGEMRAVELDVSAADPERAE